MTKKKNFFIDFKRLVRDKIEFKKYIAITSGEQELLLKTWQNFAYLFSSLWGTMSR